MHKRPQFLVAHHDSIQGSHFVKFEVVLIQYRHPFAWRNFHGPFGWINLPERIFKGRFSRPVGTNDS
jgi:hypothetical protein